MTCVNAGTANPDIGGIGIIVAFALQALLSIILSLWSFEYSKKLSYGDYDERHKRAFTKKREILDAILLVASDAQTLNGIALLISGLSQLKDLDLYHLHLVYDTVNFTSISNCAAIVCSFRTLKQHRVTRFVSISFFLVLYLAFAIAFGIRLKGWDETKPGHCYNTSKVSLASAKHPYVDNIYLAFTCFTLIGVLEWAFIGAFDLLGSMFGYIGYSKQLKGSSAYLLSASLVLMYAVLQFPLHLYSVIALRVTNTPLLQGDPENAWGFGQVVAVVMFGATLIECCKGYKEWYDWKRDPEEGGSRDEEAAG